MSDVPDQYVQDALNRHFASEKIRQNQQGLGRGIISTEFKGHRLVAVGSKLLSSKNWKTFPDFLGEYIRLQLGLDWGNEELRKPFELRHPVLQWYEVFTRQANTCPVDETGLRTNSVNGVTACYLGLAYNLYLLDHNVELQARLIKRLKNINNFQGAYYETIIAGILIRAGFDLELEDETVRSIKHCEFFATSQHTGKQYTVEAKSRGVRGLLGKSVHDGAPLDSKPLSSLIPQLNDALGKPACGERLIFIDLNAEPRTMINGQPNWGTAVVKRLDEYEQNELSEGARAYVFITNLAFHRSLNDLPVYACLPYGLGLDFNKPGARTVREQYNLKKRHGDAYSIAEIFPRYLAFPQTFDGQLLSESLGLPTSRVEIGKTYLFTDDRGNPVQATVLSAAVSESEKVMHIIANSPDGTSAIYTAPMTDPELADYNNNKEAYFGRIEPKIAEPRGPFELFEWFMQVHEKMSREKILEQCSHWSGIDESMSDDDLRAVYCEGLVSMLDDHQKTRARKT